MRASSALRLLADESADAPARELRLGARVRLRPLPDADIDACLLHGRTASIQRIFVDADGSVHFGVSLEEDPHRRLMHAFGRYVYFSESELEPVEQ